MRVGTYWHMLPEASQARKAVWDAINPHTGLRRIDEAFPLALREKTRENEMYIKFTNGSTWQVVGSDNFNSLVGSPPVGLVVSEWAISKPEAWALLAPILEENKGWAFFITTPRGNNHAKKMLDMARTRDDWFSEVSTVKNSDVFTPAQLDEVLKEYMALFGDAEGRALFNQEYHCSFDAAVVGAIYATELDAARNQGRVRRVIYDSKLPVYVSIDLGMGDSTALIFAQMLGNEVRIIDAYENSGKDITHYCDIMNKRGYRYGAVPMIFPHDADVRELGTGKSRADVFRLNGFKGKVLKNLPLEDGIDNARQFMSRCYFDEVKCDGLLEALVNYRRDYDTKNREVKPKPKHDWTSHFADSFRYLAMGLQEEGRTSRVRKPIQFPEMGAQRSLGWMG